MNNNKMAELPRRNATAVEQSIREMDGMLREGLILVQKLQTAVSDLATRLTMLETRLNLMAAQRIGHGPTER